MVQGSFVDVAFVRLVATRASPCVLCQWGRGPAHAGDVVSALAGDKRI
jgi:hypothetical protein